MASTAPDFNIYFDPKGTHDRLKSFSFIKPFTFCIFYPFFKEIVISHTFPVNMKNILIFRGSVVSTPSHPPDHTFCDLPTFCNNNKQEAIDLFKISH
jgi:hypothetical protein